MVVWIISENFLPTVYLGNIFFPEFQNVLDENVLSETSGGPHESFFYTDIFTENGKKHQQILFGAKNVFLCYYRKRIIAKLNA